MTPSYTNEQRENSLLDAVPYIRGIQEKAGIDCALRLCYSLFEAVKYIPKNQISQLTAFVNQRYTDSISSTRLELLPLAFAQAIQKSPDSREKIIETIRKLFFDNFLKDASIDEIIQQLELPSPSIPVPSTEDCEKRISEGTWRSSYTLLRNTGKIDDAIKSGFVQGLKGKEGLDYLESLEKAVGTLSLSLACESDPTLLTTLEKRFVA